MKLVYFIDVWYPVYGGAIKSVEYIARGLVDRGHELTIITRKLHNANGFLSPINHDPPYKVIQLGPASNFENPFARIWWLIYATWVGWRVGPFDVIHGIANLGGIPARLLGLFTRRPVVFTVHGSGVRVWDKMKKGLTSRIMKEIEYFVQCKIKYDVEISVDADFFKIPGNVNTVKQVIPNGVDTDYYRPGATSAKVSRRLLFVGRLHPQKSLPTLLHALTQLPSDITLHIVGSGSEEAGLRSLVDELHIRDRVSFQGALQGRSLLREYQEAQLFVLPSVYEGQPHTILEAWACGLPIAATNVGANPDMFTKPFLGRLVDIVNPEQLAGIILDLLQTDLARNGMLAREHVTKHFSWVHIIDCHTSIYEKLLGR